MVIQVRDLSKLNYLSNCKLVGGGDGLSKEVRWFWVCYRKDVSRWVKGKEIVFVTGDVDWSERDLRDLMAQFYEKNISAVIMLLEAYIMKIPDVMIELADQYSIPLFEMNEETRVVDVTQSLAKILLQSRSIEDQMGEVLRSCIYGHEIDFSNNIQNLAAIGFSFSTHNYVVAMEMEKSIRSDDYLRAIDYYQSILNLVGLFGPMFIYREHFLILCLSENNNGTVQHVVSRCSKFQKNIHEKNYLIKSIGVSNSFSNANQLNRAYKHARFAVKAHAIFEKQNIIVYDHMDSLLKLAFEVNDSALFKVYLSDTITKLAQYDSLHKSYLIGTLQAYFDTDCNVVQASKLLHIHRNTMLYRIERIKDILGYDIDLPEDKFKIMSDLKLFNYMSVFYNLD